MLFSSYTPRKCLINTQIDIVAILSKCSNISYYYVDLGDNDIRNFSSAAPSVAGHYYVPKSYSKTSLFAINWTMIGVASIQTTINCIEFRIITHLTLKLNLLNKKAYFLDLECPLNASRNVQFNCILYSVTNGQNFSVSVNFNGVLFQNYALKDQNVTISYSSNTNGPLQVNALLADTSSQASQDGLNITKMIQGKKILN